MQRLQKILSARGVCSRRKAEELIVAGRITYNGKVAILGDSADPDADEILLDGKPIPPGSDYVYILLNKPRGYITTLSDEKGRDNAAKLVEGCGVRVYPVGRLDMDSEGLLLFTNDGEFANALTHPKHEVDKTYRVIVRGYSSQALDKLKQPVMLDGYTISKPKVSLVWNSKTSDKAELQVVIHEGRNRQVRRMCAMAGMTVQRLIRVAEGSLKLEDLKPGAWRYLTEAEVQKLK